MTHILCTLYGEKISAPKVMHCRNCSMTIIRSHCCRSSCGCLTPPPLTAFISSTSKQSILKEKLFMTTQNNLNIAYSYSFSVSALFMQSGQASIIPEFY